MAQDRGDEVKWGNGGEDRRGGEVVRVEVGREVVPVVEAVQVVEKGVLEERLAPSARGGRLQRGRERSVDIAQGGGLNRDLH